MKTIDKQLFEALFLMGSVHLYLTKFEFKLLMDWYPNSLERRYMSFKMLPSYPNSMYPALRTIESILTQLSDAPW